jgi:hypothetical protein
MLTALILSTKYQHDDTYSNKSWSIASRGLFSLREVNSMEMEMLESLDFKIGFGEESGKREFVGKIIEEYSLEFVSFVLNFF